MTFFAGRGDEIYMLNKILFKWRIFTWVFHPLSGISMIHMSDQNGNYECSYLTFTKNPFSSDIVLRVKFNKYDIETSKKYPKWIKLLLDGKRGDRCAKSKN